MHSASDELNKGGVVCTDEEEDLGRVMGRPRAVASRHTLHSPKHFIGIPFSTQRINKISKSGTAHKQAFLAFHYILSLKINFLAFSLSSCRKIPLINALYL